MAYEQDLAELNAPQDIIQATLDSILLEQQAADQQAKADAQLRQNKRDLHDYCRKWLAKSMAHRRANYEAKWDRWRRNANSIYDPAKKARKEAWQSAYFDPMTLQNKEIIKSNLYRTLVAGLPYGVSPRPSGDYDQAMSIKDLTLRELQRSRFELMYNNVLDDKATYGFGAYKRVWVTEKQVRTVRIGVPDTSYEAISNLENGIPLPIIGYEPQLQERETYRGVKATHVSIWDLFFPERWSNIKETALAHRHRITYQEILDGVKAGYYFPEAAATLKDVYEDESKPEIDQQGKASDYGLSSIPTPKTDNGKTHTAYEFYAHLPQKWVHGCRPEDWALIQDPEQLIPARVQFTAEALCGVYESDEYDGTPPFEGGSYIEKPGEGYGMGVAEMLEQIQDDQNETTNQRKDNVALIMNRMGAILEQAIVSRADLVSKPGGIIRVKKGSVDDVRKAFMWAETPDVTQSSYMETANNERKAQELTAATRVTIGSGGSDARDVNQTKGGMEILRASSNERFTYYAMVIEQGDILTGLRSYYSLVYANIQPQDIVGVLGPKRAQRFRLLTPEEVDADYSWVAQGVFASTRQPMLIAQMQAFRDQYAGAPFFDDYAMAETLAKAIELPNQEKILQPIRDPLTGEVVPFRILQTMALANGADPLAGPGKAVAADTKPRINDKKAGKNAPTEPKPK